MKNKQVFTLSLACMMAFTAPALASVDSRDTSTYFNTFAMQDKNQNDTITREEYNNTANAAAFDAVNTNKDGGISRDEFVIYNRMSDTRLNRAVIANEGLLSDFTEMDLNGSGSITRNEFGATDSRVSFNDIDRNENGFISNYELDIYTERYPDRR